MHFDDSMKILNSQDLENRGTEKRYLMNAQGFVLAEDIIADHDSPSARTSAMDGYAIRYGDQERGTLKVVGINPAGSTPTEHVGIGEAVKTFTGSLMPEGSDTLIPFENVSAEDGVIHIHKPVESGFSVREAGENYAHGEVLMKKGTLIDFPQIGVLAGLNRVEVEVYTKPRVAVLATGSELLGLGEPVQHQAQLRSSNNYTIEAIAKKYGADVLSMGCVGDDREDIRASVKNALKSADIVVTTGGVSVGDFDFVKEVILEAGGELLFKGVRIKPGQHIMLSRIEDKFIVGLPGFAYSSTVTALLYVVPLIALFQGRDNPIRTVKALLKEPFLKKAPGKAEFTACNVYIENGRYAADFSGKKSGTSAILTKMLGSTGLIMTSENGSDIEAGMEAEVLLI